MRSNAGGLAVTVRGARVIVVVVCLAGLAAACGNAKAAVTNSGNVNGVTSGSITVGGVASLSGPIPADFSGIFDGVQAYFDMVNAAGGVDGRKIDYPALDQLDDASNPSTDEDAVRTLVEQDKVFAVVGVGTPEFAGAKYLVDNEVPTFGYAISPAWTMGDNLFGAEGSYVDFLSPGPEPAFLAQQVGARRVGLLAYGVTESQEACEGFAKVLQRYGIDVAYQDLNIPAPAVSLTSDVIRMKSAGVQMVISCMDVSGNVLLAQTLRQQQLSVTQYWLDGYDEQTLKDYANLMDGVYFLISHTPFSLPPSELSRYPGMANYLSQMTTYFPNQPPSELSLTGWINADLFVTGLRMVGRDLTRAKLIAAINSLGAYSGDGLVTPIAWASEHDANGPYDCNVFIHVVKGSFVPVFGSRPSVFTCFHVPPPASGRLVPIAPPPTLPGASAAGG
jgi:branched-chain amino acid transport system substrate-binding protein